MRALLRLIADSTNYIHNALISMAKAMGFNMSDKDLHFWVIGFIGIAIFFIADIFFKILSKLSISIISFIYTFTVLVVLVFAIEIEQKITGKGNMEFQDIVSGLWGFIALFFVYIAIRVLIILVKKLFSYYKSQKA